MNKTIELAQELKSVLSGRGNLIDSILPLLIFTLLNMTIGLTAALWGSLLFSVLTTIYRAVRHQPVGYSLAGLGLTAFATVSAVLSGKPEVAFLPGVLSTGLTAGAALVSNLIKRPMTAITSHLARNWPLEWYWHPKVEPAYREVTWWWFIFFVVKLVYQIFLLTTGIEAGILAVLNILLGWPVTIALLVTSYLYGVWRLGNLHGPSVDEFVAGVQPPWTSQKRGY